MGQMLIRFLEMKTIEQKKNNRKSAVKGRGYTGSVIDSTPCDTTTVATKRDWADVEREANKQEKS